VFLGAAAKQINLVGVARAGKRAEFVIGPPGR